MNKELLEKSITNRNTAIKLLEITKIKEILSRYGEVHEHGSYLYDLMLESDIDLIVSSKEVSDEQAANLSKKLIETNQWNSFMYCNWMTLPSFDKAANPLFPFGYYYCLKKEFENKRWKVDIFYIPNNELKRILRPRPVYNDEQKLIILDLKNHKRLGRLPAEMSSQLIYNAVIEDNVNNLEEFISWHKSKGEPLN